MANLLVLILQAVGPQILSLVKQQFDQTGTIMTPEQLNAKITAQADSIITKGEDWLKNHPV